MCLLFPQQQASETKVNGGLQYLSCPFHIVYFVTPRLLLQRYIQAMCFACTLARSTVDTMHIARQTLTSQLTTIHKRS